MNKKNILTVAIVFVISGAAGFYFGTQFGGQSGIPTRGEFGGNMQNGQTGIPRQGLGGMTSGDIIAQDATSMTVKLLDGGSKIVFFSDTTEISRFASGSITDLTVGRSVMVSGKTNTDGSVTAQSIQLRPAISVTPGRSNDR